MGIPTEAKGKGHAFEDDPPHAMSSVERWTCVGCGRAVLRNGNVVYGSATTEECDAEPEQGLRNAHAALSDAVAGRIEREAGK